MKIIVTGSLGRISKPLTVELVQKGHEVTVVSSNPEKQAAIEALGAKAAIGSIADVDFLTATFTGADAAYCMVPPQNYFDHNFDVNAYARKMGNNYAQAIKASGVKRVVNLSSIGAHLDKGNGIIAVYHQIEGILGNLPGTTVTFMRPVGFYYNLYSFLDTIKNKGFIAANYGADENLVWVSPIDIAAAVAEELETPQTGNKVRYVVSDELTGNQTASVLGEAIGIPNLKWILISDQEMQSGLEAVGMNPAIAVGLTEMFASQYSGKLTEDLYRNKPATIGKVKLTDFAKEFAATFNQK
ncbi:NmrA family NAD(P)-binding protein [Mucilaginibacter sp. FT3.2]|uniref:NmrA family NAD(P)-binding protein n=1 Tax=Mucilaginibacter sp. FT3.2 TaxID=2723090 RepID=UPI001615CAAF|nr:NmrA family NAD(P)-binding protein [Mucilaginibacter sp. FT3.2]MBB6231239.1 uncharacterized protein YbjT (DUF2867 family) [Mucilaginibacter sp. FT3.2]